MVHGSCIYNFLFFFFLDDSCCEFMKREIGYISKPKFPHIEFRFLFVNNTTFQGLLSHKERFPDGLSFSMVYSYECGACGTTIGYRPNKESFAN